jgi:alkanesulfonate monooxygenase SsuD/methylene tetrahydromethanopterin reductase-like flavin-dependent oxidoreductase (luciferase family)
MRFGLGLPISDPAGLLVWARAAETYGFDTLALLDRLAFDNPEPLTALAVLAGATDRIRLQTEVLLGPLRSTALLAKQAATLDRMSGGRFVLGVGVGGRPDDHAAAGVPVAGRGKALDVQLAALREIWGGGLHHGATIGPRPLTAGGPPILIGGFAPVALRRVSRYADGFVCAAAPSSAAPLVESVRSSWAAAGRAGRPRIVCQLNVAVGAAVSKARAAIADYYAFTGRTEWAAPLTSAAEINAAVRACRSLGADEVIFYCWGDDPEQVSLLAEHSA